MAYTDYAFYHNDYKGDTVPYDAFDSLAQRAQTYVDAAAFGRIDWENPPDEAKCAVCAVADILYRDRDRVGIVSENNDGYAVVYRNEDNGREISRAIRLYLPDELLFRGVRE